MAIWTTGEDIGGISRPHWRNSGPAISQYPTTQTVLESAIKASINRPLWQTYFKQKERPSIKYRSTPKSK